MNNRIFAFTLAVLLMGGLASADVVVTKKGRIHGLGSKSKDGTAITVDNWPRFIEESKGDIVYLGYRGLSFRRGRKPSVIAWSDIEDFEFNEADPDWEDGNKHYSIGDWASALGAYRDCAASAEAKPVFKVESAFNICLCLLQRGNKKAWLADPARNRYEPEENRIPISKIFDWFEEDFERDGKTVLGWVRKYAPESRTKWLQDTDIRIKYLDYDWDLNETKPSRG